MVPHGRTASLLFLLACSVASTPTFRPCDGGPGASLPYCDPKLPPRERVRDFVSRLTLEEKAGLVVNSAKSIERLNVTRYQWWNEALHGVGQSPGVSWTGAIPHATSFPQVSVTAASFNRSLFRAVAEVISTEARAFSNSGQAGLTFWTPNVNVYRDPRWGRGQETPGEDPYLTSEYAATFVSAFQGEDSRFLKASACCKHFTAYDFEGSEFSKVSRHYFNAIVSPRDMTDTFMPPFESCVRRGKVSSLMCSYNRVNGVPSCADKNLLTTTARERWGFEGYITSDCGAVDDVMYHHNYTSTTDETCNAVLSAGMDLECGTVAAFFSRNKNLVNAVQNGAVAEELLDNAVANDVSVLFRLGYFDPLDTQPYAKIGPSSVDTPAAKELAVEAARQGMILLKNDRNALPLNARSARTLAVIGPNANDTHVLLGNYYGKPAHITSVVEGISKYATVLYSQGCDIHCEALKIDAAKKVAAIADATVIVIGNNQKIEAEGKDRISISLPGLQANLVTEIAAVSKGPVIVVVISGGPVDISEAKKDVNVDAILWSGYSGQSGGDAVAEVLFGLYNPGGKLVFTIYPSSYTEMLEATDMEMRPSADGKKPGRSYRFYTGEPVYQFGSGMSYTTFKTIVPEAVLAVKEEDVASSLETGGTDSLLDISVIVQNSGTVPGNEILLAFMVPPEAGMNGNPMKSLIGFERVMLQPGYVQKVAFSITAKALSVVNVHGEYEAKAGKWSFIVGQSTVAITVN